MKSLVSLISLFLLLNSSLANASWRKDMIDDGVAIAKDILQQAEQNTDDADWKRLFQKLYKRIATNGVSVIHHESPSEDFVGCTDNTIAFTQAGLHPRDIYICQLAFDQGGATAMAQTLIHEAAHLIGFSNECQATKIERGAMLISDYGVQYRNGYFTSCGF